MVNRKYSRLVIFKGNTLIAPSLLSPNTIHPVLVSAFLCRLEMCVRQPALPHEAYETQRNIAGDRRGTGSFPLKARGEIPLNIPRKHKCHLKLTDLWTLLIR
jgi:hypothetical protein